MFTTLLASSYWSASASLGYTLREYEDASDREDNQYYFGVQGDYSLNRYWRFSLGYRYSENDSDDTRRSYDDHSVTLTAALRY